MSKYPPKYTKPAPRKSRAKAKTDRNTSFKIKLRGKDNAPLSMQDLRQGLYDIARKLSPYTDYRAKWVTVYLTLVDEDGQEVQIDKKGEWTLYPYRSAADEEGV